MPGKRKNKKKAKQVQVQTGLPTPPDTPTTWDEAMAANRDGVQCYSLVTTPDAPDGYRIPPNIYDDTTEARFMDSLKAFFVTPRPLDHPPLPSYNYVTDSGAILTINYNRWPLRSGHPGDEWYEISDGKWAIGESLLRNRLFFLSPIDTCKSKEFTVCTMVQWLLLMESQTLDLPYTLAQWTEYCRMVWTIISLAAFEDASQMIRAIMDHHCLLLGRQPPDAPDEPHRYVGLPLLPSPHSITGDIIQHYSTFAMGITVRNDPIRGKVARIHTPDPDAWVKLCNEMNALCVVVDNNKLRTSALQFKAADRQTVLKYYADHPIPDHTQALPTGMTSFAEVNGEPLWTSTRGLADCEAITVQELAVPKRHVGRSLLCRVLTRCRVHSGISFVVEDTNSQPIPVTILYPFPFPAIVYSPAEVQSLWPVGTCFYIKEPYVRTGLRGRAEILVAWPKDLVEIPPVAGVFDDPDLLPATNLLAAYRLAASIAFIQARPKIAIRLATIGLNLASLAHLLEPAEDNDVHQMALLKGRATTYWLSGQPGAAYSDCLKIADFLRVCDPDLVPSEGLAVEPIRLQAAYKLRLFTMASRHLQTCERLGINSKALIPYREAIKLRMQEKDGKFSISQRPLDSIRSLYLGPIKTVTDPVKGRKVITTRAVKSGEVLLVEEPVVNLDYDGSPGVWCYITKHGQFTPKRSPHEVSWAVHQVMDDPSIGQYIQCLSPDANTKSKNLGLSDEERLRCFQQPCEMDVDLVERQLAHNAFGSDDTCVLYGLTSMINHSCKANVIKSEKGENEKTHCLRAVNDMEEGEELFISYLAFRENYNLRHKSLKRSWSFDCECELCLADEGDRHEQRGIMMGDEFLDLQAETLMFTEFSSPRYGASLLVIRPVITKLLKFASRINATYSTGRTAKPELSQVYFELDRLLATCDASEALQYLETGYRHLDWEIFSAKELKTSKKAVKKYGYHHHNFVEHAELLQLMRDLYQRKNMEHASAAYEQSLNDWVDLNVSPIMDREVAIRDYLYE